MYELWNDVSLYFSICAATFENECVICNHAVMLFCFFLNNVQGMFWGASLFNIDVSSWNTSKVTKMQAMFKKASSFNNDVSSWETSRVTNMGVSEH